MEQQRVPDRLEIPLTSLKEGETGIISSIKGAYGRGAEQDGDLRSD